MANTLNLFIKYDKLPVESIFYYNRKWFIKKTMVYSHLLEFSSSSRTRFYTDYSFMDGIFVASRKNLLGDNNCPF